MVDSTDFGCYINNSYPGSVDVREGQILRRSVADLLMPGLGFFVFTP